MLYRDVFLTDHGLMHVSLLCVNCLFSEISDGQRTAIYLVVNITLYAPEQDTTIQFCNHVFLVKPKAHPGDCEIP